MIAVVGHPDLAPWTLTLLEEELRERLARYAEAGRTGLVRVGQGLPVAFGRAAQKAGLALVTVVPPLYRAPALLRELDQRAAGELLLLSQHVRLVDYDPADRNACVRADERLLRACARVLAIWDGTASDDRDTTAHLVAYARSLGIDVEVLWPDGAKRLPTAGERPS
ncbi:hypothetical protein OOK29_42490 [Streptomyces phaeochromogenes]|uniref:hypothetical protein n=1 Tax=Streptomyces TaxID=1883 RepID=UPI0022515AEA|nr:hypothetical protein [Streptomyces phaeochromogenes]MCX5604817.1 hypothetical protein [Streptomyces phaeochromogenes]